MLDPSEPFITKKDRGVMLSEETSCRQLRGVPLATTLARLKQRETFECRSPCLRLSRLFPAVIISPQLLPSALSVLAILLSRWTGTLNSLPFTLMTCLTILVGIWPWSTPMVVLITESANGPVLHPQTLTPLTLTVNRWDETLLVALHLVSKR